MVITIKIDLENDEDFIDQVKCMVKEYIRELLYNQEKFKDVLAGAIDKYLSWKYTNIEKFAKDTIVELIGSAVGDKSSLPKEQKAESVIVTLLRESITNVVSTKIKNIQITGLE